MIKIKSKVLPAKNSRVISLKRERKIEAILVDCFPNSVLTFWYDWS